MKALKSVISALKSTVNRIWFTVRFSGRAVRGKMSLCSRVRRAKSARFELGEGAIIDGCRIAIDENSVVSIGAGAVLSGRVDVGRNCKVKIGSNFRLLNASLVVYDGGEVEIGGDFLLKSVDPDRALITVMDGRFSAGNNVSISGAIWLDRGGEVVILNDSFLNQRSELRCEKRIEIGNYVMISYNVFIYDSNTHSIDWRKRRNTIEEGRPNSCIKDDDTDPAAVAIGDDVWIGRNSAVLKGVTIGERSVVGACSVIVEDIPSDSLAVGHPAEMKRRTVGRQSSDGE